MLNKIIDAHRHLPKDKNINTLFNEHTENGIEYSVLLLNNTNDMNALLDQKDIFLNNKDKILLGLGLNLNDQDTNLYFKKFDDLNLDYAIKIHSRYMKYSIKDVDRIIKSLYKIEKDIIIVDAFLYGHELQYNVGLELALIIAEEFKDKKVIMAHSGGINILKVLVTSRTLKNIFFDLSLTLPYLFDTSIHNDIIQFIKYNTDKIMFGSDAPDFTVKYSIEKFYELFNEMKLNSEDIEKIMYFNAKNIYNKLIKK